MNPNIATLNVTFSNISVTIEINQFDVIYCGMKTKEIIEIGDFKTFDITGEMEVNLSKIIEKFNDDCIISQWHEKFTLSQVGGVKCAIPKIQAIQLIELLKLKPIKSDIFNNATTWVLQTSRLT